MSKSLPERPDLGQLKKQAKDLLDAVEAGNPEALERLDPGERSEEFALHDAQRVVARAYGFASWAKLKLHVETRTLEAAEARLISASLEGDEEAVRTILAERPGLANRSIYSAAALGDDRFLRDALRSDPASAKAKGGPQEWDPLHYLCFGRCGGSDSSRANAARTLLAAGADPNSAHIAPRWPESPQAVLYGVTGVNDYPQLARVLLQAGADPNDCESRYHAAEKHHEACLEVLGEFGADFSGRDKVWGNSPLNFLLGWQPHDHVRRGIEWLLDHGADPNVTSGAKERTPLHAAIANGWDKDFIRRLLDRGANPASRSKDGRSVYAIAVAAGRDDVAALLRERGADDDALPLDRFLGACMRGDAPTARAFLAQDPILLGKLPQEDPALVFTAAREGRAATLVLLAEFGFDLAAADSDGATPLHWAAWHGRVEAVKVLIAAGADIDRRDNRFDAFPLGWCDHGWANCQDPEGDYLRVAELLLDAGAKVPPKWEGIPAMRALLKRRGRP
ncbi:MAG: ankyrin repeat domain-containing protein [Opitutaceae bacterium]|jgi:ankyrin repeat protein